MESVPEIPDEALEDLYSLRADQSCKECRRRKARCDRSIPTCDLCGRYGRHCLYEKHSRTPLTRKHLTEVEERLERATALIKRLRRNQANPQPGATTAVASGHTRALPNSDEAFDFCELDTPSLGPVFGSTAEPAFPVADAGTSLPTNGSDPNHGALLQPLETPVAAQQQAYQSPSLERPRLQSTEASDGLLESPPRDDFEWDENDAPQHQSPQSPQSVEKKENDQIADGMASLAVNERESGYLGIASGAALLRIIEPNPRLRTWSLSDSSHSQRYASLAAQPDPNRHIVDSMIDAYFRGFHLSYPIVHEPTFRAQYAEVIPQPHGRCWQVLAYTVAAIGAYASATTHDDLDLALFRHAKSVLSFDFLEIGNLTLIQALTLISNYQQKRDKPNSGYNYLGLAVRMATGMGLHKEFPGWNISPLKMEIRRRVWWTLCVFDVGATITFSRPMVWPYDGVEVAFPLNIADRDLTANSKACPSERAEVTLYTAVRTQARFHISTNPIYSRVISKPFPTAEEMVKLDDDLLQPWVATLPPYFRGGSAVEARYAFALAVMQWRYWNFRIIMYRPFVISRDPRSSEHHTDCDMQAYNRCLADAKLTISSISEYWSRGDHNRLEAWYALYFLFQASLIPCICLRHCPEAPDATLWCQQISMTLRTIRAIAPTNASSVRCYRVIVQLCGQYLNDPKLRTMLDAADHQDSEQSRFEIADGNNNLSRAGQQPTDQQRPPGHLMESPQTQAHQMFSMMWPNASLLDIVDESMGDDAWSSFLRVGDLEYPG